MEERRQQLCRDLAASVKKLQGDHVLEKKTPESGDEEAERLCQVLEEIFLLDLKNEKGKLWRETKKPNMLHPPQPSFWTFIDPMVSEEVKEVLMALTQSDSDVMKCRSWLRVMLNKALLVPFLEDLQRHPGLLSFHYGGDSLLRDPERLEIVIQLLKGLSTIQLSYNYTNLGLTKWNSDVLQRAGIWMESSPKTRKESSERAGSLAGTGTGEGMISIALKRCSRSSSLSQPTESLMITREEPVVVGQRTRAQTLTSTGNHGNMARGSEDFSYAVSLDFEVVTHNTTSPVKTLTSLLTKLVREKGLDTQNYLCAACRRPIGVIFGPSKLCKYTGQHYCFDCHTDDERVIPSRVLFNWDFRRHRVCRGSCEFLDSISETAVLNVEESNPALYMYIPEMKEALRLRQQLNSLREYLATCRGGESLDLLVKRLKCQHLFEETHSYSIQDLCEVQTGALQERMRKTVKTGTRHVRQCPLCSQKGFICEGCHGNNIIYPFDLQDTFQCPSCSALYHHQCQPGEGDCAKCLRVRRRREATVTD